MQLKFGKGDILVTQCGNSKLQHVLMEQGRGSGEVGTPNLQHADRQPLGEVSQEDVENATVTLTFDNPVSVMVVLEKLLVNLVVFRREGKTIDEQHKDLIESVKELWAELLGYKDESAGQMIDRLTAALAEKEAECEKQRKELDRAAIVALDNAVKYSDTVDKLQAAESCAASRLADQEAIERHTRNTAMNDFIAFIKEWYENPCHDFFSSALCTGRKCGDCIEAEIRKKYGVE